jgi:hypothetical protein
VSPTLASAVALVFKKSRREPPDANEFCSDINDSIFQKANKRQTIASGNQSTTEIVISSQLPIEKILT